VCMLVSVVSQLTYPSDKILPRVEVANQEVGGMSTKEAGAKLEKAFKSATITVKTQDKHFDRTLVQAGANISTDKTAEAAAHYSTLQRFIPFSALVIMSERNTLAVIDYDSEHLTNFAKEVSKEGYVAPVNASVSVKKGKAELVPAKPSKEYAVKDVEAAIHAAVFQPKTTVVLTPIIKEAPRSDDEVKDVLADAQAAVDMPLTLTLDKETIAVNKETIGSWLDFPENTKTKRLELGLKVDVVKKYLEGTQAKIYKAPGTTKVTLMDGKEVSRTEGQAGRGIDMDKTVASLQDAVKKGKKITVSVTLADIPAQIVYERKYSSAGLSALLASLTASKGSYAISVMDLSSGRSASSNGSKQYVAASTYKLFVAYAVIKEVEAGRMNWSDSFNGQTVGSCFDKMIIISDNACPKAFAARIGWQTIEDEAYAIGMSQATQLTPSPYTTANDLALFLYKLQNGTIISGENRDRLLNDMKQQSYSRAGIPAGTGVPTADKVGDVDGYKHDAAIVYGPKGPYVIVVMTSGGSWSGIADVARQVHAFLNN